MESDGGDGATGDVELHRHSLRFFSFYFWLVKRYGILMAPSAISWRILSCIRGLADKSMIIKLFLHGRICNGRKKNVCYGYGR